jgi:hypothetical protein
MLVVLFLSFTFLFLFVSFFCLDLWSVRGIYLSDFLIELGVLTNSIYVVIVDNSLLSTFPYFVLT